MNFHNALLYFKKFIKLQPKNTQINKRWSLVTSDCAFHEFGSSNIFEEMTAVSDKLAQLETSKAKWKNLLIQNWDLSATTKEILLGICNEKNKRVQIPNKILFLIIQDHLFEKKQTKWDATKCRTIYKKCRIINKSNILHFL